MQWSNLISRYADVPPGELILNEENFRIHTPEQQDAFRAVVEEIGWIDRVTVSERTGIVLNGHLRVKDAINTGADTIPVRYVDVTPEQERLILATFDRIGAMAIIDEGKLSSLLDAIAPETDPLKELLNRQAAQYNAVREVAESAGASQELSDGRDAGQAKESSARVVIGFLQFFFEVDDFSGWFEGVRAVAGESDEEIELELRKRLGFSEYE